MGRKADINNLIRDAEHKDKIVIDAINNLETAKANSAEAWVKVEKRRKELEQVRRLLLERVVGHRPPVAQIHPVAQGHLLGGLSGHDGKVSA